MFLLKRNYDFNGIIDKEFFLFMVTPFSTFEPLNNNPPKRYIQFHQPPTLSPHPLKPVQEKHELNLS